jgi:hypothetical protein
MLAVITIAPCSCTWSTCIWKVPALVAATVYEQSGFVNFSIRLFESTVPRPPAWSNRTVGIHAGYSQCTTCKMLRHLWHQWIASSFEYCCWRCSYGVGLNGLVLQRNYLLLFEQGVYLNYQLSVLIASCWFTYFSSLPS